MSNIFEIQESLLDIFNQVEENEGELTPELEKQLIIKEDELKYKVKSYTDAIKYIENDLSLINEEIARLNALKKSKDKLIKKLKDIILYAVQQFGSQTKSGTKCIDWGTGKVSTRKSQVLEVDSVSTTHVVNKLMTLIANYQYLNQWDVVDLDAEQLLMYAKETSFDEINITDKDLSSLDAEITVNINVGDILKYDAGKNFLRKLAEYTNNYSAKPSINKTILKTNIKENLANPSFAKLVNKESITIK